MTWIQYWASKSKGKKFTSKAERMAYMRKVASEWKSKSGSGESILLQPGLSATTARYVRGIK